VGATVLFWVCGRKSGRCGRYTDLGIVGVKVGVANFLEWAWQIFFLTEMYCPHKAKNKFSTPI